jgi:hypothetical protein
VLNLTRPISESNGYIDISSGSSEDFNKIIKSFTSDITEVFNEVNENDKNIRRNQDVVMQENLFLQRKINEMEDKIKAVEAAFEKMEGRSGTYKIYKNFHTIDDIVFGENYSYDNDYGVITMDYENSNEISLSQYPKDFLINNINISVDYETKDGLGNKVGPTYTTNLGDDPSLINIIDRDTAKSWVKNIEADDNVSSIDFVVTVEMPVKIIPNLFVNSIGLKAHPVYSMDLNKVEFTDADSKTVSILPSYPMDGENPQTISQLENLKLTFPTISSTKFKFSLTQPYSFKYGDKKVFTIGFKSIELESIDVSSELGYFITKLDIPSEGQYFSRIMEPTTIFANEDINYGDLVRHELMYSPAPDSPTFSFGSDILSDRETVYVKTVLKRSGETIPSIKGIEFSYLPK